jgi:hypothetical protein
VAVLGLAVVLMGVGATAGPGSAQAAGIWKVVPSGAEMGYYLDGQLTSLRMSGPAFKRWAERTGYGVQSLGTGVGSGYTSQAANGVAVIEQLKTVGTTAGTIATVRGLKGDTMGLMSRLKSYGLLKGLGTIALAATSFEFGWKVGSKLASLFGFQEAEEAPNPGGQIYPVSVTAISSGEKLPNGSITGGTATNAVAPGDGFYVNYQSSGGGGSFSQIVPSANAESGGKCAALKYPILQPPESVELIAVGKSSMFCVDKVYEPKVVIGFIPIAVSHLPGETQSPKESKEVSSQTPESGPNATTKVEECLGTLACARLGEWWFNHDPEAQEDSYHKGPVTTLGPSDPLQVRVPSFGRHEHYEAYGEKLEALELVPEYIALPEGFENPAYGPEEVTQVNPKPTTQLKPETVVKVRYNPATAPANTPAQEGEVPGSGGPWSPPTIPGIDMSPLSGVPDACSVFPFGLFCWLGDALGQFNTAGVCPGFDAPVASTGADFSVTLCGETAETIMGYLRPAILLAFTVGLGFLFARGTRAVGGD